MAPNGFRDRPVQPLRHPSGTAHQEASVRSVVQPSKPLGDRAQGLYTRGSMEWILIGTAVVGLADVAFAIVLFRASDGLDVVDEETRALAELGNLEGPSGQPFFADADAVWDLAGSLEDPTLRESPRA